MSVLLSPLDELKIADSRFLGFCGSFVVVASNDCPQSKQEQEQQQHQQLLQLAREFQAHLKASYPDAAHVPMLAYFDPNPNIDNAIKEQILWDEDGEPDGSIGPEILQEIQEFILDMKNPLQSDRPSSLSSSLVVVVVIVRFFVEKLLGVTCGRLGQCYRSIVRLALYRYFYHDTIHIHKTLLVSNHQNIYGMGAGDCELILNVVQESNNVNNSNNNNLVKSLLSELRFDGFKGASSEELPRLQNLQADRSSGSIPIYRYPGNYSGDEWTTFDWSPTSLRLKTIIEERLKPLVNQTMNHCVTNYYRDGKDCIAHHGDKDLDLNQQGVIVSLSLGDERILELRRRAPPQDTYRIRLPHGSMLVLGPYTNREWTHSILPKPDCQKSRLSLTMREVKTFQDLSTGRLFGQGAVYYKTLRQVRTMEWMENVAFFSGFCIVCRLYLGSTKSHVRMSTGTTTNTTTCTTNDILMVGTFAIGTVGLRLFSSRWKRKSEERAARDFFTKMSSAGTKY
jgi:hypothetical protein